MASQNLSGLAVLRAAGYEPRAGPLIAVTGLVSLLPRRSARSTTNLAAISAAICTGPDVHPDPAERWKTGPFYALAYLVFAMFGASLVAIFAVLPPSLIVLVAGLALLAPLANALAIALKDETERIAATVAFAVTASGLTLFGIGSAFWGLVAGWPCLPSNALKNGIIISIACPVLAGAVLNRRLPLPISKSSSRDGCLQPKEREKMNTTALIRPAWTPATIALMVIGFMVFWPLGLAMLAYIIWGDRLDGFKRDVNRATDGIFAGCRAAPCPLGPRHCPHRQRRLRRLAREGTRAPRRRAPQARRDALTEFDDYARELRRAKDQEEFDRFMAEPQPRPDDTPRQAASRRGSSTTGLLDDA